MVQSAGSSFLAGSAMVHSIISLTAHDEMYELAEHHESGGGGLCT